MTHKTRQGFTLIELSIVLVIIGLIVGGVLVGQDLIRAAAVRAQISQIEKFNTAVNTFKGKYGALPGDMNVTTAAQFGFTPRGSLSGQGDGNGVIEGYTANFSPCGYCESAGESVMFWVDLTTANGLNVNLIDGAFNTATPTTNPSSDVSGSNVDSYLPPAKIGNGNNIAVFSSGGVNYFSLEGFGNLQAGTGLADQTYADIPSYQNGVFRLTVSQAYGIDKKMDDGLPLSGNVESQIIQNGIYYGSAIAIGFPVSIPYTNAQPPGNTTCFDNGNVSGGLMQYSLSFNNGASVACTLSFRFQ